MQCVGLLGAISPDKIEDEACHLAVYFLLHQQLTGNGLDFPPVLFNERLVYSSLDSRGAGALIV